MRAALPRRCRSQAEVAAGEFGLGEFIPLLDERGASLFSQMADELPDSSELLFMALGWLAREGYVVVSLEGADYRVALRSARTEGSSR